MNAEWRRWIPLALCCVPGIAIVAVVGIGLAVGGAAFGVSFGGPLGLGLVALALLVCPLHMGWMMWRMRKQQAASEGAAMMACCPPEQEASTTASAPSERLQALRAQREALEREVAELRAR